MLTALRRPLLAAAILAATACGGTGSANPTPTEEPAKSSLVMAFVPSQTSATIMANAQPIADYLTKEVGVTVTPQVATSYAAVAEGMTSNLVDVAWVGPLDYVIGHQVNGSEPMTKSVRNGQPGYNALIIAHQGSGITGIKDLKGHSFAFGDPISASSSLYPQYYMKQNGINPNTDLSRTVHISNQTAIAVAVCNGTVDAGAIYQDARTNAGADTSCPGIMTKAQVVFTTPQLIPGDPQIVRHSLNSAQKAKVKAAMLKLGTDPTMAKYLKGLFTIDSLVPASDADYTQIRQVVQAVDPSLLKGYPSPSPTAAAAGTPTPTHS